MNTVTIEIENKVSQFLDVIEKEIQRSRHVLLRLEQLRSLVIKRDDDGLGRILSEIKAESGSYKDNEIKRQLLRRDLASFFGCRMDQMTLTKLQENLSGEIKDQVTELKENMQIVTQKLRKEHLSTAMLLAECARFNRMLLKNIFEFSQRGTVTYSPNGQTQRQGSSAFMNIQF
jgi:hypothetical protein